MGTRCVPWRGTCERRLLRELGPELARLRGVAVVPCGVARAAYRELLSMSSMLSRRCSMLFTAFLRCISARASASNAR
jgi:hypothetical protein